jgi:hypothetical protein
VEKGEMMKGLVAVFLITTVLLCSVVVSAGSLELYMGGGPSTASCGEINTDIDLFNTIITELNDTPIVTGDVPLLDNLGSGIAYQAGERFWLSDRFALGGKLEYFRASTATSGTYTAIEGSETSTIALDLDCYSVGLILGGRYTFLDAGIRLSADLGVGYYYTGLTSAITFEIPTEYPPISFQPQEGEGRYTGSAFGFEGGITLSFNLTDWFEVGTSLFYRNCTLAEMSTAQGTHLDLDGDDSREGVDLGGITVQFTLTIDIDLSLITGGKE